MGLEHLVHVLWLEVWENFQSISVIDVCFYLTIYSQLPTVPEIPNICQSDIDSALDECFIEVLPNLIGDIALWIEPLIETINILINPIHLQRVGNWKGFLEFIRQCLTYCFNYNRHNHACNLSYCHMRKGIHIHGKRRFHGILDGQISFKDSCRLDYWSHC